jgi:hypothetical protein
MFPKLPGTMVADPLHNLNVATWGGRDERHEKI